MTEVIEELLFCRDCKTDKPLSEFTPSQLKRQRCRACNSRFSMDWAKRNKERLKDNRLKRLEDNPEAREREREQSRRWRKANPEKMNASMRNYRVSLRDEVLTAYGRECACCGEDIERFLSIDHVDGNGAEHPREIGVGGNNFYTWLKRNNFPDGFQTLCHNCNIGRYQNGGTCPHKEFQCDTLINTPPTKYMKCLIQ